MATGEHVLFFIETITRTGNLTRRLFRTREAARIFLDREIAAGRQASNPQRVTWGPEQ